MSAVHELICATSEYLQCLRGPARHDAIVARLAVIREKIAAEGQKGIFTLPEATRCMTAMAKLQISEADLQSMESVCVAAVEHVDNSSSSCSRTALQDYCSVIDYFTEQCWESLLGQESHAFKCDLILKHCKKLGLRCPSESTFQTLAALFLSCCFGVEKAMQLGGDSKHETLKRMKMDYKRSSMQHEGLGPIKLPVSPTEFMDLQPELWTRVFGESCPKPCKLQFDGLTALKYSIPMRITRKTATQCAEGSLKIVPKAAAAAPPMDMASFLGSAMQQMFQCMHGMQGVQGIQMLPLPRAQLQIGSPATPQPQKPLQRLQTALALQDAQNQLQTSALPEIVASPNAHKLPELAKSSPKQKLVLPVHKAQNERLDCVDDATQAIIAALDGREAAGKAAKKGKATDRLPTKSSESGDAEAKAMAKAAARATATSKTKATKAKAQPKAKPKAKPKTNASCETRAEKANAKGATAKAVREGKKPHFADESTRKQFLARTGIAGIGQSKAFKYDNDASKKRARAEADQWVKQQCRDRGWS